LSNFKTFSICPTSRHFWFVRRVLIRSTFHPRLKTRRDFSVTTIRRELNRLHTRLPWVIFYNYYY
jgi:hypothetical protein